MKKNNCQSWILNWGKLLFAIKEKNRLLDRYSLKDVIIEMFHKKKNVHVEVRYKKENPQKIKPIYW